MHWVYLDRPQPELEIEKKKKETKPLYIINQVVGIAQIWA